jgi:hypothetical protein
VCACLFFYVCVFAGMIRRGRVYREILRDNQGHDMYTLTHTHTHTHIHTHTYIYIHTCIHTPQHGLPSFQWKMALVNFMNQALLRPEETLGKQYSTFVCVYVCVFMCVCVCVCLYVYV